MERNVQFISDLFLMNLDGSGKNVMSTFELRKLFFSFFEATCGYIAFNFSDLFCYLLFVDCSFITQYAFHHRTETHCRF